MATQEELIQNLLRRVAELEHRASAQSVRMSTIDDHIKRLEKDMAVPKLALGDALQPTASEEVEERLTQLEGKTDALGRM